MSRESALHPYAAGPLTLPRACGKPVVAKLASGADVKSRHNQDAPPPEAATSREDTM